MRRKMRYERLVIALPLAHVYLHAAGVAEMRPCRIERRSKTGSRKRNLLFNPP